jgi:hypothetical protein
MDQTRHRSLNMVRRYIRDRNLFNQNVSGLIGLLGAQPTVNQTCRFVRDQA